MNINKLHLNACGGDSKAIEELFEVLTSRFRLFAHHKIRNRVDAEEVVQEALMTVYAEYNAITFKTSFSAWACKVLDNRILNYLRKKQRESKRLEPGIDAASDAPESGGVNNPDLKRRLLDCLQKLCRRNLRYARILNLHYQGYSTGEICKRIVVKPETLYSALSKARALLETCLEKGELN